jgi:6,7-dimethyl-8-ribityllumazine synthase
LITAAMFKIAPRPRAAGPSRTFAIVASQFNALYVNGLIDHARKELHTLAPRAAITLHRVPGAFEIPIVVRELASQKNVDAIIALGVILQGETSHAENLARSVTDGLQRIALDHGVPVIHAVLSFANEDQAHERCLGSNINRGTEAARTAVEIANTLAKLRA